jgi:hypothetical protein
MAFSSSTKTSRKFVVANKPLANFFQHLSFAYPNPKQNEHFRPQLLILCPPSHLAHFGLVSTSLKYVEVVCFSEWHNWQQLLVVVEKVVLGLALSLVPFPKKLMRVSFKTWNCQFVVDSSDVFSSCSFSWVCMGSPRVFPPVQF